MSNQPEKMIVGIDFDNTIVNYSYLLKRLAVEKGYVTERLGRSKKEIRDQIRQFPHGEIEWQKLQALMYGPRILEAEIFAGVMGFFCKCRKKKVRIAVISHKTEFAGYDSTKTNLRTSALEWMEANNFFSPSGANMKQSEVFFLPTRKEKVAMIKKLGCTHFIDDLEETFQETEFPTNIMKVLFSPGDFESKVLEQNMVLCQNWAEVSKVLFATEVKEK